MDNNKKFVDSVMKPNWSKLFKFVSRDELYILAVSLVVIIAGLFALQYFKFGINQAPFNKDAINLAPGLPANLEYSAVPMGEYPVGFPEQVILPASSVQIRSADITYKGVNQKIVELYSTLTPDQTASLYKKTLPTLPKPKWELKSETRTDEVIFLVFSNGNKLEVLITPSSQGSQVKLTYFSSVK